MKRAAAFALGLLAPAALTAQRPLDFDARIQTIEWQNGAILPLRTAIGGSVSVVFAPGEAVQTVVVGDPSALDVAVAPQADALVLRTLARPASDRLEVRTQLRTYQFRLLVGPANDVVYAVRFSIGPDRAANAAVAAMPAEDAAWAYAVKGEESLRPAQILDDGVRTYIAWGPDQALPAIFAVNPLGQEETVDSYMRGELTVIDRVYSRLVFRMGKRKAEAVRRETGSRRTP